jgi:hypothetical protein
LGLWTITRRHTTWGSTKTEAICGKSTDTFSIGLKASNWCAQKQNTANAQIIVNQDGTEMSWGWFCENQGVTEISGTPTFVEEAPGGPCAETHGVADSGTL